MNDRLRTLLNEEGKRRMTEAGMREDMAEQSRITSELVKADPQLSAIGAIVMANDRMARLRMQRLVEEHGIDPRECGVFVGSYERLAFWRWAFEQGRIDRDYLLDQLVDDWSSSDPDDSDMFWLECWELARERNEGPIYSKSAPKVSPDTLIKVYRGQPEGAVAGIAWSRDVRVAKRFAITGGARATQRTDGVVYEGHIYARDCYAFLWERGEQEVVLNPMRIRIHEGQWD